MMNDSDKETSSVLPAKLYFIDPFFRDFVSVCVTLIFSELIGLFGIVANIINMINFKRQGFQDGVNVTLFSLAICDAGALLAHQFSNVLSSPWIGEYDLFMSKMNLFINIFYFNGYFVRVGGLLTAFMNCKRCASVVWPLKVKSALTGETVVAANVIIAGLSILYLVPPFYVVQFDLMFIPSLNRSILAEYYISNRHEVMTVYYFIADQLVPYGTMLVLILCTITIVTKLRSKLRWRQSVSSAGVYNSRNITLKEHKVVKMLVTISVIFIVCLLPQSTLNVAMGVVPGLKGDGIYISIFKVCYSFTSLLETINCSVSILVYYKMSTRYRQVFWEMFNPLKSFSIIK
ncbi:neuropeptides capa receptor [Biomphalaria glabrata]|nr:neuropeptides capa receptor-like [Biomphalaria glabrata]